MGDFHFSLTNYYADNNGENIQENNGENIQENRDMFPEEPIRRWPVQRGRYDHEAGPSRTAGSCEALCKVHCPCHPNYQSKVTGKGSAGASGLASSVLWRRSNLQRAQSYGGVGNNRQENPGTGIWEGFWTPPPKFIRIRERYKAQKIQEDIYKYWFPSDESPRVGPELSKKRIPSLSDSGDNVPKDPQASTLASGSRTHNDREEPIQRLPIQRGGSEDVPIRPPDEITTASNPCEQNENPPSSAVNNPEITVREEHKTGSNHRKDRHFKKSWFKKAWFKKPLFKKPSWFKK